MQAADIIVQATSIQFTRVVPLGRNEAELSRFNKKRASRYGLAQGGDVSPTTLRERQRMTLIGCARYYSLVK